METMSLVEALATSASHAAEAQSLGHNILRASHNGRTGAVRVVQRLWLGQHHP